MINSIDKYILNPDPVPGNEDVPMSSEPSPHGSSSPGKEGQNADYLRMGQWREKVQRQTHVQRFGFVMTHENQLSPLYQDPSHPAEDLRSLQFPAGHFPQSKEQKTRATVVKGLFLMIVDLLFGFLDHLWVRGGCNFVLIPTPSQPRISYMLRNTVSFNNIFQ